MRLIRVELQRFRSRRAIALMMLGIVFLVGWMTIDTIYQSRAHADSEIAAAQQQAEREQIIVEQELAQCQEDPGLYFGDPGISAAECPTYEVRFEDYLTRPVLDLPEERRDTGLAAVLALSAIGVIIGATFAGGDWATGSMSNQLLFRPRRAPVWAAKAAAVVLTMFLFALVVVTAQWAAYFSVAEARGLGWPDGFVGDLVGYLGRGVALIVGASLGGYALTMALRNTIGTLALLFFYSVGGEALIAAVPVEQVGRLSLAHNVAAWLNGGAEIFDDSIVCERRSTCVQTFVISQTHGAVYLGVLLVVVGVVSLVLFRRRDVP